MPSSPSSGGMLSSWAVNTREKAEEKHDVPFASPRRRGPADLIERSLYRAFASYDKLPTVVRATASETPGKPRRAPTIHLPPLDPVRFPRLTNPEPNELSDFTSERQLRKQRKEKEKKRRQLARQAELARIARAADAALADERPYRLSEIYKRWDTNGDGRISIGEAEAMFDDAMSELMPPSPTKEEEEETPAEAEPAFVLGCEWRLLEGGRPDEAEAEGGGAGGGAGGVELRIEKLSEALEAGKLTFTAEELDAFEELKVEGMLTVSSYIEAESGFYSPVPPPEPAPTGPRPSTVWQRFDGDGLAAMLEEASDEALAILAEATANDDDDDATPIPKVHPKVHKAAADDDGANAALAPAAADPAPDAPPAPPPPPPIRMVDARFLLAIARDGGPVPVREEIPEEVFIDLPSLLQMEKSIHGKLRVLWVNGWSPSPMSEELRLKKVCVALKAHIGQLRGDRNGGTFAVYVDQCSLTAELRAAVAAEAARQAAAAEASGEGGGGGGGEGGGEGGGGGGGGGDGGGEGGGGSGGEGGGAETAEGEEAGEMGQAASSREQRERALAACVSRLVRRVRRHPHVPKLTLPHE